MWSGQRSRDLLRHLAIPGLAALARKVPDLQEREGLSRAILTFGGAFGTAYGQMRGLDRYGALGSAAGQALTYLTATRMGWSLFRSGPRFRQKYGERAYQEGVYQYILPIAGAALASFAHALAAPGKRTVPGIVAVPAALYLVATGLLLWRRALRVLGADSAALVYVYFPEAGRQVQSDLYRVVRHPLFAGVSRALLGMALMRGKVRGLMLAGMTLAWLHLWVRMEEDELVRRFGPRYDDYRSQIPAMLPDSLETERRLLTVLFE